MPQPIETSTQIPAIRALSDEQVRDIHYATLQILGQIGVEMQDPQGRKLLLEAGAWESNGRLKIPERLLVEALASAPSRIPMYDRLGNLAMPLELGKVFFGSGSDTIFTLDINTGERRRALAQDVEDFARLSDALENIDFVMSMGVPSDVPVRDTFVHEFAQMIRGSVKPNVYTAQDRRDMEDIYRIAAAVAGGEQALREKPFLLLYAEPISPLLINEESLQKIIFCAEKGIPCAYIPSPNPGGGGPVTLAGAIAVGNAECLAGLIVSQLVRPGTPFLYGMNTAALDMKTTIVSYGSPEWSLGMAAWTELARYYNLPVWGYAGASDSKVVDAQAGIEATFSIYSAFISRCTLVHDVAYIEYGSTSSMEMLVIADEIISMIGRFMRGVPVNQDTLALEAIARTRPGSGFLADDHTLQHFRDSQWSPRLIDRKRYDLWQAAGAKDMFARANERARKILARHQPPPLPEQAEALIDEILRTRSASQE
ncbi:MAG: trimethylamine methyltransferase family protein [Anaerolineales bacterium]|nr:trimethylamine methyltransferase family protein [Anaerolineales bacterium]